MSKRAIITGISGQDGSFLAEFLLEKKYEVHGIVRRSSSWDNISRIKHICNRIILHSGDMSDTSSLFSVVQKVKPNEVYNLAAQSDVPTSFDCPEYTIDVNGTGALRLLTCIRKLCPSCRYYQASSSELFGDSVPPQNLSTPFSPISPYAIAKLYAYWTTVNYRNAYGMHASNGILFNHESSRRSEQFVTKKITVAVASIKKGSKKILKLGNINTKRDWGFSKEYVEAMWLMLQQTYPDDYIVATGESHSVKEFCNAAFDEVNIPIKWEGSSENTVAIRTDTNEVVVAIDKNNYRPTEVNYLCGDATETTKKIKWSPKIKFRELVSIMVKAEMEI